MAEKKVKTFDIYGSKKRETNKVSIYNVKKAAIVENEDGSKNAFIVGTGIKAVPKGK